MSALLNYKNCTSFLLRMKIAMRFFFADISNRKVFITPQHHSTQIIMAYRRKTHFNEKKKIKYEQ